MDTLFPDLHRLFLRQPRRTLLILGGFGVIGILATASGSSAAGMALLFGALLVFLALTRPQLIIGALALYVPLEPFVLKYISDDFYVYARYGSEALIYLLLAAALVYRLRTKTNPSLGPTGFWLIAFIAWAGISALANHVPSLTALLGLRQMLRFPLLGLAAVNLPIKKAFVKKLLWALFILLALESFVGLSQSIIGSSADAFLIPSETRLYGSLLLTPGTDQYWESGQRITATLGRYDQLGMFLSFFLLIGLGVLYELRNRIMKRRLLIVLLLGLAALLLTYSRAAWFGFAIGAFLIAVPLKRNRVILLATLIIVGVLVLYPFITSLSVNTLIDQPNTSLLNRFYEAFSYERWRSEYYGLGRVYFIVTTFTTVVPASPIFGFGPGQYGGGAVAALGNHTVYEQLGIPFGIYGTTGQIDNNWLSLLGETGIVGISLFLLIFLSLARFAYRSYREEKDRLLGGAALGFLGALLAASFQAGLGTHFEVRTLGIYLWLIPALLFVATREETKKAPGGALSDFEIRN